MARRFCAKPWCNKLVSGRFCPQHERDRRQVDSRFYREVDITSADNVPVILPPPRYGRIWRARTKRFLADHPFCIDCEAEGQATGLATEVDHEVPHRGDRVLFWDERNWRPRCKSHHSKKTAREVGFKRLAR